MITLLGIAFNFHGLVMLAMNLFFLLGLWRELKKNNLDSCYLNTRDGKKVSATKILQLVDGFFGTWIVSVRRSHS